MTDIEGSTRLWQERRAAMAVALEAHDRLLRTAVEEAGGTVVKTTGDGLLAAFDRAEAAVRAALEGQRALDLHAWAEIGPLRVRMAINSGSAEMRDGDYFGPALNRVARLMAIGHGGQVLISDSARGLVVDDLAAQAKLIDLGEHRLRDLDRAEHVYQLAAPGLRREFPPLRTSAEHPTNLRPQVTSFVGRERELAEVGRLLTRSRLVTLVGVGGTGKTRLELQAAGDALERYADGAWLVELAPLSDPELVVSEISRALAVQLEPSRPPIDTIVDFFRSKELLLLLDNCEHLIATAAVVAQGLLASCPGLTVLATSREPLGVDGEAIFSVPSLTVPDLADEHDAGPQGDAQLIAQADQAEAVRLFVERAGATLPTFSLDRSNVHAVVEICRRLDGIPLALELAAARINVLSAEEIAQGLGDRFRLLTGGRRTAVPRQRTLQAMIDWSWDLLDDEDRQLVRRLAVFSGGWTLDTAAAVAFEEADQKTARFAAIDGLGRLVDRSLVVVEHEGSTRYRMLETIRQYAADQLTASGETVALRDRHLRVMLILAQEAQHGLAGPESPAWLKRLDTEVDNIRAALDWALETRPEASLEICVALARYWQSRTMGSEGYDRLMDAVVRVRALPEAESPAAARARSSLIARGLSCATILASMGGRSETLSLGEEAVVVARESGDPTALADALYVWLFRADVYARQGNDRDWRPAVEEALAITTDLEDWGRLSRLELSLAMIDAAHDPAAAEVRLQHATQAAQRSGNPQDIAYLAQMRGRVATIAGRNDEAQRHFRESQARFEAIDDRRFALSAQSELGHALRRDRRLDEAETVYRQSIRGWQRTGNRGAVANQLESFAFLALARGQGDRAARLFGAAAGLREVAAAEMTTMERVEYDAQIGRLHKAMGEDAFKSAWAAGRLLTADEAVTFALSG